MKRHLLLKTMLLLCALIVGSSNVWAAVVSGTTYNTTSTSGLPTGWSGSDGGGTSYIKLTASSHYIQTSEFIQNGFTSIKLKARTFSGPSAAQALITVSWYDSSTSAETVLGTIAPSTNELKDYTISLPTNPTGNTSGYIKIQCKGASSSKGSGVSQVTITYTAGTSKTLSSISVTTNPKTAYKIGETLDLTGIVVTGTYDDNSTENVTSECTFSPANGTVLETAGDQNVVVSYNNKNCNLPITVASVTGLAVKTAPTKVKYRIGDYLDLTGLVLTATYSDEGTKDITVFTASPADASALNTSGNVDVTLSYYGQSCTQRVTVGNLSSITYNASGGSAFDNTTYTEKDTFNPEGLVITAHFDNDLDVEASGYTLSPTTETELATSDKTIIVSYTWNEVEKTVNIPITVNAGTRYTVSFDAGNGTYTGGAKTETEYKGGVVMPTPTGIPDGWSFYGWAASKQTSETNEAPSVTAAGATYYPTANVTLYAVYSLVEGGEKTITATDMSGANSSATTLKTGHPITYKVSNGANSNPMRWYSGGILTMAGATMSKIQFTMNGSYSASDITLNAGGGTYSNGTWTGESSEVKFRTLAQVRIDEIKVTYTSSSTVYTSLPAPKAELSYAETEYDAALGRSFTKPTLTNTNGVTVTYESEDEDVATVDEETGDVTIVGIGTTTITASFAGNSSYRANSASYTLNVVYGTIAQIKELTSTSTPVNFNALLQDAVVTYVNDDYAYLQDASAAVMVNFEDHGLTAGDKINGKVTGTVKANYAIDVFTAFDKSAATVTDDGDIPAAETEKTLAQIKAAGTDYDGKLVTISGAKVTTALTDVANGDITDDDGTTTFKLVCPYTGINVAKDAEGNFTGFVSIYVSGVNTTYRLNIYEESQISLTKNAPTAQPLAFASDAVELDEDTDDFDDFAGQTVSGAQGTVTYALTGDAIGTVNENSGAVTLNGTYGTATITATAAAKDVTEGGVTTPYIQTSKSYTVTTYPRYTSTFNVNGVETVVRQATHGAEITVPTPGNVGDYYFMGWKETTGIDMPTDEAPAMVAPPTTPTSNVTYYAVYAQAAGTPLVEHESTFTIKQSSAPSSPYEDDGSSWTWDNVTFKNDDAACINKTSGTVSFTLPDGGKAVSLTINKTGNTWALAAAVVLKDASNNTLKSFSLGENLSDTYSFTSTYNHAASYTLTNSTGSNAWVKDIVFSYTTGGVTYSDYCTSLPIVEITIPASGYLSYCSPYKLDFSETEVKAYKASVNGSGNVTLTKVDVVPANTGVVLYCETPDTYTISVTDNDPSDVSGNQMKGVLVRTQVLWNPETNVYNYILQGGVFKKASDGYLKPNRAYLSTSYNVSAPGAKALTIVFNDATTGINGVEEIAPVTKTRKVVKNGRLVIETPNGEFTIDGAKIK